jgi:glycerophosphoryl diester phosphodiesterase
MSEQPRKRVRRVGHKGAAHIEHGNTLASFDAALRHSVDMIELDVLSESSDGSGRLIVATTTRRCAVARR